MRRRAQIPMTKLLVLSLLIVETSVQGREWLSGTRGGGGLEAAEEAAQAGGANSI